MDSAGIVQVVFVFKIGWFSYNVIPSENVFVVEQDDNYLLQHNNAIVCFPCVVRMSQTGPRCVLKMAFNERS